MSDGGGRVFTVVLNYRHVDDTLRCIGSLRGSTYRDQTVVVVDNGSDEAILASLRKGLDATTVLQTGRNLGYAAGNNIGIAHALERDTSFVWILNPDTEVEPGALDSMMRTMRDYPEAGIVGGRILNGKSNPPTVWFNGGVIEWEKGAATSHRDAGRPASDLRPGEPRPTDYATGASMLVRRTVFDSIGLLPERYFLYFEETDFCVRARSSGWEVLLDPRSTIWHYQRSYGALPTPHYIYYFVRNRLLFGQTFTEMSFDRLVGAVSEWVDAWRDRIRRNGPAWLDTYDQLVGWAIEDARAGRDGERVDIQLVAHPGDGDV